MPIAESFYKLTKYKGWESQLGTSDTWLVPLEFENNFSNMVQECRKPWNIALSTQEGVTQKGRMQGCIFRLMCSHRELTMDHVLTSAYVKFFRTVTRNAVNKSVWRKKDCTWLFLNKDAMKIWLSSLRIRAHLSWRTGTHLYVLHVLWTYSTCSHPGW